MRSAFPKKIKLIACIVMIGIFIMGMEVLLQLHSATAYAGNLPSDGSGWGYIEEEIEVEGYDPTVVPDNLIRSSSGLRKQRKGASGRSVQDFTCFGDQLGELSRIVYNSMVNEYAVLERTGDPASDGGGMTLAYRYAFGFSYAEAQANNVVFPVTYSLDENGNYIPNSSGSNFTIDRTSAGYRNITYQIQSAVDAFSYDYPDIFWYRPDGYSISYTIVKGNNEDKPGNTYTCDGFMTAVKLKMKEPYSGAYNERGAFKTGVFSRLAELDDADHSDFDEDGQVSDLEFIQSVHDFIIQRMSYDYDGLNSYQSTGNYRLFTAAGAFLDSGITKFVCEGYSKAMKILLNARGIPCCLVAGETNTGEGHMWNAVCLDESWYLLDCTWDDKGDNPNNANYYVNYLVPTLSNRTSSGRFSNPDIADAQTFLYPVIADVGSHDMVQVSNGASVCVSKRKYQCNHGDGVAYWLPAVGHVWENGYTIDREATCALEGQESIHCTVCGQIQEDSVRSIEKLPHTYGAWETVTEATCTQAGSKKKECTACGAELEEAIPANGHTWDTEYTLDREATCALEGQESIHCTVCRQIQEDSVRSVEKLPHTYGAWETVTEATCTQAGSKKKKCIACGTELTETIPANGHSWDNGTVIQEVTLYQNGQKKYTCSACKATRTEVILPTAEDVSGWIEDLPELAGVEEEAIVAAIRNVFSGLSAAEQVKITQQYTGKLEKAEQQVTAAKQKAAEEKQKKDGQGMQQGQDSQNPIQPQNTGSQTSSGPEKPTAQTTTQPANTPQTEKQQDNTHAADGTAVGKGASVSVAEKALLSSKSDEGPKGSQFGTLALRQKKVTKKTITVTWNKISGATYTVYGNVCGKPLKKLKTLSGTVFQQKKLKKGTYYKFIVVASKNGKVISTSKTVHIATTGKTVGNPKKIKVNQSSLKLGKKKTFRIKAEPIADSKKRKVKEHRKISYESDNPKVAGVSAMGKIKALKKGKAVIYVYAQNGVYAKVKVTVK